MKKINKSKVIIPALALIALTTAASTTGTAAWFYASRTATVTGMTVKTQVSSSMLIAPDTLGSTTVANKADFVSGTLSQTFSAFLEPASTVDGKNFFYTTNATSNTNGSKASGDYIEYNAAGVATDSHYADKFSQDYGVTNTDGRIAKPFADYVFQVKVLNNTPDALALRLTTLKLKRPTDAAYENASKAFRVAVFTQQANAGAVDNNEGDLQYIYKPTEAAYQTDGKAVSDTNAIDTVSNTTIETTSAIESCAAGAEEIYKIVVRLWIEGEDTSCNTNTFANLTSDWALNLGLALDNTTAAATELTVTTA